MGDCGKAGLLLMVLHASLGTIVAALHVHEAEELPLPKFECPQGLFVFGASMVDTGNFLTSQPFLSSAETLPYGMTFFGTPSRRFADGRVLVDFFSQAFQFPLLTPYLRSVAADFRRGSNFAYAGSTILKASTFYFGSQQSQFVRFRKNALQVQRKTPTGHGGFVSTYAGHLLTRQENFDKGLYIIRFNLRNDLVGVLKSGVVSFDEARNVYSRAFATAIENGVQNLYKNGARQFFVFKFPALGCSPEFLTFYAKNASLGKNDNGCLIELNEISDACNTQLVTAVEKLRGNLTDATILLFDFTAAQKEVLDAPAKYGFSHEKLLQTCCGFGGKYNFDSSRACASTYVENNVTKTVGACANPDEYVIWDGIHDTDAYSGVIAKFALTGQFLDPPIDLNKTCNLDFRKFRGANVTTSYPDYIFLT